VALSVQYLDGLARVAGSPEEAARLQRQIAAVHLGSGDREAARQAFLKALDFHPDDLDALAGLRDLAMQEENWQGLVGVLSREATMVEGEARLDRYREIARIWEQRIGEKSVAIDAWRKVLESAPEDPEALDHLVALTRAQGDWAAFVDVARPRLAQLDGAGRAELQTEIGRIYLEYLYHEAEAIQILDAASSGPAANLEAAQILERIFAGRGEWEKAVVAMQRQAAVSPPADAVRILARAAQIRLETLHDQDGVAELYGQVLALDRENLDALRFRGAWLYRQGDLAGAVEVWRRLEGSESGRDLDDFDVRMEVSLYFYRYAEAERWAITGARWS
jgi:tetratricopeptide (TPR) repeat protein